MLIGQLSLGYINVSFDKFELVFEFPILVYSTTEDLFTNNLLLTQQSIKFTHKLPIEI